MASLVLLNKTPNTPVELCAPIVIDDGEARVFDSNTDVTSDIIGVSYPQARIMGSAFNLMNGPEYYDNGSLMWNEDLTYQIDENEEQIVNENFVPWNPFAEPEHYTIILTHGFAAVSNNYTNLPSQWKLISSGTTHSRYFIR